MTDKKEGTVLAYPIAHPTSLCRIPEEQFDAENAAAEEAGTALPWTRADDDAESDAKTFDDLDEDGQAAVIDRQTAKREAREEKEAAAEEQTITSDDVGTVDALDL